MKTSKVGAAISCMTSVLLLFFSLVSATPIPDVRTLYLIPEDRSFNPAYQTAISDALLNLQDWYADQLGGKTFTLSSPIVEPVFTGKPSTSYSSTSFTQYFFDVSNDAFALRGGSFFDANQVSVFYMDAEGDGSGGAGVAVLPAHDLRGLVGLEPLGVNRWIGGLGHELGHAFGLRHPPACEMSCPFGPLMGLGYLTYPDAFLLPEDKAILNASPFFTAQDSGTPPTDGHTAAPEPYAFLLLLTGFLPITLMRKWQEPISRADKILDGHESGRGRVTPTPWNRRSRLYADSRRATLY